MQQIPSATEIKAEFSKRRQIVKERAESERVAELQNSGNPEERVRRNVVIQNKIYISGDITAEDKANPDVVKLSMKPYNPKLSKTLSFFSSHPPESILGSLANLLDKLNYGYKISEKNWKLKYDTVKVLQPFELDEDQGI